MTKGFRIFGFFFLLMTALPCLAKENLEKRFLAANQAYASESYNEAIRLYAELKNEGIFSGALFYNLGNAYAQTRNWPEALLAYRRAQQIDPRNTALRANIAKLKKELGETPKLDFFNASLQKMREFTRLFTFRELLIVSSLFYLFSSTLLILRMFGSRFSVLTITSLLVTLSASTATALYWNFEKRHAPAILKTKSWARAENKEDAIRLFEINAGAELNIIQENDSFFKIRLEDGRKGWIEAKDAEKI